MLALAKRQDGLLIPGWLCGGRAEVALFLTYAIHNKTFHFYRNKFGFSSLI